MSSSAQGKHDVAGCDVARVWVDGDGHDSPL
jgi:hypothetical protein